MWSTEAAAWTGPQCGSSLCQSRVTPIYKTQCCVYSSAEAPKLELSWTEEFCIGACCVDMAGFKLTDIFLPLPPLIKGVPGLLSNFVTHCSISFYTGSCDLNSAPHACVAGTLPTDPSPQATCGKNIPRNDKSAIKANWDCSVGKRTFLTSLAIWAPFLGPTERQKLTSTCAPKHIYNNLKNKDQKTQLRGWRDSWLVKNTCCSYRGPRFSSQHPYTSELCNSSPKRIQDSLLAS